MSLQIGLMTDHRVDLQLVKIIIPFETVDLQILKGWTKTSAGMYIQCPGLNITPNFKFLLSIFS